METEGNELVREYQFRYVSDFYTHLNEIVEYGSGPQIFKFYWLSVGVHPLQNFQIMTCLTMEEK